MNGSGAQPGSMGSGPIGRATSPQPPNSGIAGLPNKPSNATTRYSLGSGVSSSGSATSPTAVGSGKDGSAGASKNMSVLRSPNLGSSGGGNNLASSPISSARGLRPSSEMLSGYPQSATGFRSPLASASFGATAAQFANAASVGGMMKGAPESDAIDKWFEDLQHYEATLEEMAAASLDLNFKEELSAIEQWFRVLSEAERTAALYSLLQESTQVQIRFFITVLQQMTRSDPVSALLSPGAGHNSMMAEQMDNKLSSLGLKSPAAMKSANAFRPQSDSAGAGFLSPNTSAFGQNSPASPSASNSADAAGLLAAQRAKLNAKRTSAPGQLAAIGSDRNNYSGLSLDQVQEGGNRPVSPAMNSPRSPTFDDGQMSSSRPKSTEGLSNMGQGPRPNGPLDDALSPIPQTGSWASMMNTPMMNNYNDEKHDGTNQTLDGATSALNDSFNRLNNRKVSSKVPNAFGLGNNSNLSSVQGVLSGMYDQNGGGLGNNSVAAQLASLQQAQLGNTALTAGLSPNVGSTQWINQQNDFLRSPLASATLLSPNALAGLQSPSGGLANPVNMQMMNAMAGMGGLQNMSAAQFIALQQSMLQQQAASSGQFPGMPMTASLAGSFGGQRATGLGSRGAGLSVGTNNPRDKNLRSPRTAGGPQMPATARAATFGSSGNAGAAGGEEEIADLATLNDTAAWLRQLRLHKYTTNFEKDHWRDMVLMDEKALEDKGVAAMGARRKMLKTFELVRAKYDIKLPGEEKAGEQKLDDAALGDDDKAASGAEKRSSDEVEPAAAAAVAAEST